MKAKITDKYISSIQSGQKKAYEVCDISLKGFRLVVRPSGTLSFVYCYRNRGGRWLRYTIGKYGVITTPQARSMAKDVAADVRRGVDIQTEKKVERKKVAINRQKMLKIFFEEKYKPYLEAEKKTGERIAQQLKNEFLAIWGEKVLTEINPWLMEKWQKKKLETVKPATTNRLLMHFKALMNKAVEWDVIGVNPIAKVKQLKEDKLAIVRYLADDEELRLRCALQDRQEKQRAERRNYIKWCNARKKESPPEISSKEFTDYLYPMVILALNTGMRRGELFSLSTDDIDLRQKLITIHGYNAKSGSTRHIPLNDEAFSILVAWLNQEQSAELVFPNPNTGKKFDNIGKSWGNLVKRANIQNFRFHDLRHSFASKLVMKGVDLYTVKELLGHSTLELTQRYAHLSFDHKTTAVNML